MHRAATDTPGRARSGGSHSVAGASKQAGAGVARGRRRRRLPAHTAVAAAKRPGASRALAGGARTLSYTTVRLQYVPAPHRPGPAPGTWSSRLLAAAKRPAPHWPRPASTSDGNRPRRGTWLVCLGLGQAGAGHQCNRRDCHGGAPQFQVRSQAGPGRSARGRFTRFLRCYRIFRVSIARDSARLKLPILSHMSNTARSHSRTRSSSFSRSLRRLLSCSALFLPASRHPCPTRGHGPGLGLRSGPGELRFGSAALRARAGPVGA